MKIAKPFFLFFLLISIFSLSNGCATLPRVSEKIDAAPTAGEPLQIVSSKGLLSPEKSKAIMERLTQSVNPTDILERYTAVVESVTESPLTKGNKVTLLIDGPAPAGGGSTKNGIKSLLVYPIIYKPGLLDLFR